MPERRRRRTVALAAAGPFVRAPEGLEMARVLRGASGSTGTSIALRLGIAETKLHERLSDAFEEAQ